MSISNRIKQLSTQYLKKRMIKSLIEESKNISC